MQSIKSALITGVTGQDGAYLAEYLLTKGYEVHGIKRRASSFNTSRIDHLYKDPHEPDRRFVLHHGDLTDSSNLIRIVQQVQPDEIYNLAAQSHVAVSFEEPEYTGNTDGLGALRLLEAIRILGLEKKTRYYQASTSELYGLVQRDAAKRNHAVLPAQPVCRGQALRVLDRPSTTARPTASTRATASSSTTRARCAAKPSSRARSRGPSRASRSGCRIACTWAT